MYEQGMRVVHRARGRARAVRPQPIGYINSLYDCFVSLAELERLVGDGAPSKQN